MRLLFAADNPPLAVIVAAKISNITVLPDPSLPSGSNPCFIFSSSGLKLQGTNVLLRYLGRVSLLPNFYGQNALESVKIDEWLDHSCTLSIGSEFENGCKHVDSYLSLRTFLVGHKLSVADIAIWSGLAGSGQRWESIRKLAKKYLNLIRWFDTVAEEYKVLLDGVLPSYVGKRGVGKPVVVPAKEENVKAKNAVTNEKGKTVSWATHDIDLPDAKVGEVCLRFAPEPSGYLHLGHSKAALLNYYFAKKYDGLLYIRFDDTNPSKESNEFVDNILNDIKTLGIEWDDIKYTSDYFPDLLGMAERLILEGKAYIDDTPQELMQKERMDGIESKSRNNTVTKNMYLWKEMIQGSDRGQQCCLRGKLDMQAQNKSLRDPVYYRCNLVPHHRVGEEYKIYPTYDFACPFVDASEGITHALRSSEYHDRNAQYYRILEDMGLRWVQVYEFSRLNMVYTLLSKRQLLWFVVEGKVDGWDDPRFPTVQGLVRRGLKIEALIQFILEQGASKNVNLMEWDKLWTINKKMIDPFCARHTAVVEKRRVMLTLINVSEKPFFRVLPRHKKCVDAGTKITTYANQIWLDNGDASLVTVDEEITLMDWGNAIIKDIIKDEYGIVTHLTGVLHPEGSVKTTKLKLTWLAEMDKLVKLSLVELDHLITKKKLEENELFIDVLNPCTKKEIPAIGDSNIRDLKLGEIIQLERKGYFRCDVPFVTPSMPVVLIAIPDGRRNKSKPYCGEVLDLSN
ncbi:hypothetical protein MKW94_018983 [Papaver nudicaule]|uniref:glutamate--tRNA ligase n=1 Tax=Papaver nudicaule TaxID=74823 RepID=A0AA41S7R3_PAPNU|nr:hypothetical protein [Papaver nudicaule]